ncbi:MAG: metalloregulator ArsR/SmtB family transcription factor [Planctomycetota bacterium]
MKQPGAEVELDRVFGALSDPTRRGMLAQLSEGETNVSALAAPYDVSQPAISKHLRVLERAGLIRRTRRGREHHIKVDPRPIEEARGWIATYAKYWQRQFDAVDEYLQERDLKNQKGT